LSISRAASDGLAVALLAAATLGWAEVRPLEAKTLRRPYDPVVVRTALLTGLPDRATARCRLYAARAGAVEPIPFQFDARDRRGALVLSDAEFTFDDDDELVFMAEDTGDRVAAAALPAAADGALEIAVTDPAAGTRGWAYLVHFPGDPPPRSPVRYARYDPERQEAHALFYDAAYSHDRSNFLAEVRIAPAAGGTGEPLIRRLAMRIHPVFSLLLTTWGPTFTEESFSVVPDGLKNGPVRAVRRVRESLDLGRFFPEMPSGTVTTYYYASSFATPSTFSIPWLPLKALRDFRFESVDALDGGTDDVRYWDADNPDGIALAGGERPAGSDRDHDWWVVSSRRGTLLHALHIPAQWRAWGIARGIVFRPPAGTEGGVGYSLLGMTNLRQPGAYALHSALVVLPHPYRPGDEAEALAMFRAPLETQAQPLAFTAESARRATPRPAPGSAGRSPAG
jgi:hypothetical protein